MSGRAVPKDLARWSSVLIQAFDSFKACLKDIPRFRMESLINGSTSGSILKSLRVALLAKITTRIGRAATCRSTIGSGFARIVGSEEARLHADLRPPLKLYVPISGIQLSRRCSPTRVRTNGRNQ